MATIKSFTSLEQSRKLAEILPLESADMRYEYPSREKDEIQEPINGFSKSSFNWFKDSNSFIYSPCWSLAALLGVLPKGTNISTPNPLGEIRYSCWNDYDITYASNPVDACYEMILKLKELKML